MTTYKTYTDPGGGTHQVNAGPYSAVNGTAMLTHVVLARSVHGWILWSRHSSLAAAERSATVNRLKSGNRVIVELEDVP